ncbi:MAG: hypothetical protein JNK82_10835 [Myxococcaceae bacterium]|nr:hypothetical protein [Myxococcaceae bacterium]
MSTSREKTGDTGNTSRITSKTGSSKRGDTSRTQKSDNPADDADPRRGLYNDLMRLQVKAPVKALMRKIPEDRPVEVAFSSTRPELMMLLTTSGFALRLGRELVGFFEQPMFRSPREGLEGFDFEAIQKVVLKKAGS